jgi:hypothetical protein
MRGYFSFALAFVSTLLVLSLLLLYQESSRSDLSRALSVERAYGVEMDVKETAVISARLGAEEGFGSYDRSHSVEGCMHCPDNGCMPYAPPEPPPPNYCSPELCLSCFREADARSEAASGALFRLDSLRWHAFDGDFDVSLGEPEVEVFLRSAPGAKNGLAPDYLRFRSPMDIRLSSDKFMIDYGGRLPAGMVVDIERPG